MELLQIHFSFLCRAGRSNKKGLSPIVLRIIYLEAPVKLTTSGRGKLTTCFAGEDLFVQVC